MANRFVSSGSLVPAACSTFGNSAGAIETPRMTPASGARSRSCPGDTGTPVNRRGPDRRVPPALIDREIPLAKLPQENWHQLRRQGVASRTRPLPSRGPVRTSPPRSSARRSRREMSKAAPRARGQVPLLPRAGAPRPRGRRLLEREPARRRTPPADLPREHAVPPGLRALRQLRFEQLSCL